MASYVKYFELTESMQGKPVHIEFEGVESGMALWLNVSYVGYTEDSVSAHAFDLTPYLQPGVNKLAVQVFKWTSSSWCEDQDFFRFSGKMCIRDSLPAAFPPECPVNPRQWVP